MYLYPKRLHMLSKNGARWAYFTTVKWRKNYAHRAPFLLKFLRHFTVVKLVIQKYNILRQWRRRQLFIDDIYLLMQKYHI